LILKKKLNIIIVQAKLLQSLNPEELADFVTEAIKPGASPLSLGIYAALQGSPVSFAP